MKGLSLDISGLDGLKKKLEQKSKNIREGVEDELTATAFDINRKQKRYAPVDTGRLRSSLSVDVSKGLSKEISANVDYAPFIEFGTGGLVEIPAGLEEIAQQFRRKGVRKINLTARPFFFRAYFEEKPKLIEKIRNLLK